MMVFGGIFSLTLGPTEDFADFCMSIVSFVNAPAKNGYWYLMTLAMFYLSMQFFRLNRCESGIAAGRMLHASHAVNRFVYGRDIFGKEKEQQTVSKLVN